MEDVMKKLWFTIMLASFLCAACIMTAGPHGARVAIAPPLPVVVELDSPYYVHSGFHYYYNNDRWYYSQKQGGPWTDLPRDRYPREVKYRGKSYDKGKGWKHGQDRD